MANGQAGLRSHHALSAAEAEQKLGPENAMEDQAALDWTLKLWIAIHKNAALVDKTDFLFFHFSR
jgi:hypothetical protein